MNRLSLNSGALNGTAFGGLVLATALVACSATAGATATRAQQGGVALSGQATCVSQATYQHGALTAFTGAGGLYPQPTHKQVAQVDLLGSASLSAYVLRDIQAYSSLQAGVQIIAVVASAQGQGTVTAGVGVTSVGTRIQKATVLTEGVAGVTWSAQPVVWRMHQANLYGQVVIRVEPTINNDVEAYVDNTASADMSANALCTRQAQAELLVQANGLALGTCQQPGYADAIASGLVWSVEPHILATLRTNMQGEATVQAAANIVKLGSANVPASAEMLCSAKQLHAGGSVLTGGVEAWLVPRLTGDLFCTIGGAVDIVVAARRSVFGASACATQGDLGAQSFLRLSAETNVGGTADAICEADITVRYAESLLESGADMTAQASLVRFANANATCDIQLVSLAHRLLLAQTSGLGGSALVYADTVTNPEAIDVEYRTFLRPAYTSEFLRPPVETEFKRTA